MSYACSKVDFPHRLCISKLQITHAWVTIEMYGESNYLIFASRKLAMCSKIEHNIIEAITITCCEY